MLWCLGERAENGRTQGPTVAPGSGSEAVAERGRRTVLWTEEKPKILRSRVGKSNNGEKLAPRRGNPKPLVLAAFFPPFLSLLKEMGPPEAGGVILGGPSGTPAPTNGYRKSLQAGGCGHPPLRKGTDCHVASLLAMTGDGRAATDAPAAPLFMAKQNWQ